MQSQTAVTTHVPSKQLLLFALYWSVEVSCTTHTGYSMICARSIMNMFLIVMDKESIYYDLFYIVTFVCF